MGASFFFNSFCLKLDLLDVCCLGTLGSFGDLEGYCLALGKALETVALNGTEMYEYILAIIGGDETVPLSVVEPFYCAL